MVEKDILRVGHWKPNGESWHVTPTTLRRLCGQFNRYVAAGNTVPWIEDHDGGAGKRIGDVVGLRVDGDTLIARCQVTQKKYALSFGENPGDTSKQEVSVEVYEPWEDGAGNFYPIALTHLANVINPVVTGQKPFKRLLSLRKPKRIQMADEATDDTEGEGSGGNIPFGNVTAMLEKYFEVTIPDSVTDEATLDAFLAGLITTPGEETETENSTEEVPADMQTGSAGGEGVQMSLKNKGKPGANGSPLEREVAELRRRLALHDKSQKESFHAAVDGLCSANKITPAKGKELKQVADTHKVYSLSLLSPYQDLPANAVHLGGYARRMGAGATEGGKVETPEEKAERARAAARGGAVKKN